MRRERDFFTDNLLVRVHFIIVIIRWTGLAPWEFEFPFPGSLASTFLQVAYMEGKMSPPREARDASPDSRKPPCDNLLVRIHFIIVMIRWTGLAPWGFGFPFPGSLTSTFHESPD